METDEEGAAEQPPAVKEEEVCQWLLQADQEDVKPGDSASQAGSSSSVRAARASASGKKAAALAKMKAFEQEERLMEERRRDEALFKEQQLKSESLFKEQQLKSESLLKKHQLQSEFDASQAEEEALAFYEDNATANQERTRQNTRGGTQSSGAIPKTHKVQFDRPNFDHYPTSNDNKPPNLGQFTTKNDTTASAWTRPATLSSTLNPTAHAYQPPLAHPSPHFTQQMIDIMALPKSELMTFDGEPMDYHMFMNSFNSCVGGTQVSDITKLNKLFELCKGKALNVIKPCAYMIPAQGYRIAQKLLSERFGNGYVIAEAWIAKLTSGPQIKGDNVHMLQDFLDDVRSCTETLRAIGHMDEVDSRVRLVKLVKRLPYYLQGRWRKRAVDTHDTHGKYPGIELFLEFLTKVTREACDPVFGLHVDKEPKSDKGRFNSNKSVSLQVNAKGNEKKSENRNDKQESFVRKCFMCGDSHYLNQCDKFKNLSGADRLQFVKEKRICFTCLNGSKHVSKDCRFNQMCGIDGCNRKHSRLLHNALRMNRPQGDSTASLKVTSSGESNRASNGTTVSFSTQAPVQIKVALPIVPVYVRGEGQQIGVKTFALLDTGSNRTFCSEKLRHQLGVQGKQTTLNISTINDGKEMTVDEICLSATSAQKTRCKNKTVVLSKVCVLNDFPSLVSSIVCSDDISQFSHLKDLPINSSASEGVYLLIGQDNPEALVPLELRRGKPGEPYGVRTPLGWTVNGPVKGHDKSPGLCNYIDASSVNLEKELNSQVEKFWKVDSYGTKDECAEMSMNDRKVLKLWDTSVTLNDNHYQLDIPFKQEKPNFPDNRQLAEKRLGYLGRRLMKDDQLHSKYADGIHDLLKKGFAEKVEGNTTTPGQTWYIPHHPVFNPNKPDKLRIVFDCAAQYQNTSLNKEVFQGPDLTNKLIGVLLRFRENKIGIMADIEAMFYQIKVSPKHRDALRFLWWSGDDPENPVDVYRMTVHIFGGVWSPSVSNYALKRTAEDFRRVIDAVMNSFYVDDLLQSVVSVNDGKELSADIRRLLSLRGFNLTKWVSNSRDVLSSIPQENRAKGVQNLDLQNDALPVERALGVEWITERDVFSIKVKIKEPVFTRRGLLSIVSAVYDPLGIVCPFVLIAKKLFQAECKLQKSWDDPLEEATIKQFTKWMELLVLLRNIEVPRCVVNVEMTDVKKVQLHHFCDASEEAYGTATYLRIIDGRGKNHCSFMFGKSRLSPLKQISIPRLELCAAVTAVHVNSMMMRELRIRIHDVFFWSDSSIVLYYIHNASRRFQTFVANRLTVIHEGSTVDQWRHVSSGNNPADDASRGLKPDEIGRRWLNGPAFLHTDESAWPEPKIDLSAIGESDIEVKRLTTSCAIETIQKKNAVDELIDYYSDWFRLKKGVSWILKFISWMKNKKANISQTLSSDELKHAEHCIIRYAQAKCFRNEMNQLKSKKSVERCSTLYQLEPFLDEQGLLRIGGRLRNAVVAYEMKHQLILPRDCHVSLLLVRYYHEFKAYHSGTEYVLSVLRTKYWIVKARYLIRKIIRSCVICKRLYGRPMSQRMSDLPSDRVVHDKPPFTNVGIDCFGPFYVKRGRAQEKRYGCIFTCLVVRAIHIEMLHSLEADSFVNGLQRFICRRGTPELIRSDNGTNFVGGSRELLEAMQRWNDSHKLNTNLQHKEIKWIFNPPAASHMGGVWERQIRTVRKVMNTVIRNAVLDDERLCTLFCEVESIVNNRPITRCSDIPQDVSPLTPNHLLLLRGNSTLPADFFNKNDLYRRRWRHVQHLADRFWTRWIREYLPTIRQRQKWLESKRELHENDIVLVFDESTPRNSWPIARVITLNRARDGHIRSAVVKTKSSNLTRPVTKLCLLEGVP